MRAGARDEVPRRHSGIASAFSHQLIGRVGGMAGSLVTLALTTHYLGPASYGRLQTAIMFVALWTSLTELGLGSTIVRRVTGQGADLERLTRLNCGVSTLICLPLTLVALGAGELLYTDGQTRALLAITSASLILTTLASTLDPVFMVDMRFAAVGIADFLGRMLSLCLTIVLVVCHCPVYWFAIVQLVPPAVQLVVKYLAARTTVRVSPLFVVAESWSLIREALPQTAILIIGVLYWRIDGVLLSLLSRPQEVGKYALAYTVAFSASLAPELFLKASLSTTTELFARNRAAFARFVRRGLEAMYLLALPLGTLGACLAAGAVTLLGSADFSTASGVLALLCVAAALTSINAAASQALFAAHEQVFLMRLNIANLVANIVFNVLLIPRFGADGAAIALIATELLGIVGVGLRFQRYRIHIQPWGFVLKSLPATVAAAGVALAIRDWPIYVSGPVALAVYIAVHLTVGPARAAYLTRVVTRDFGVRTHPAEADVAHPREEHDGSIP